MMIGGSAKLVPMMIDAEDPHDGLPDCQQRFT